MSRRVAVTGASGFIGWHVCERFRDAGWNVAAVVRPGSRKPLPDGVERVAAPLDSDSLTLAFAHAELVVHLAGVVHARTAAEYRHVNVEGTQAAAEAAVAANARLIHISSLTAAGPGSAEQPRVEADPREPITAYGISKLESESAVRAVPGLRWVILRPAAVYGPRDRQFLPLFRAARYGIFPRLPHASTFAVTMVHVADLAAAIVMAALDDSGDFEAMFIGHPDAPSIDTILRTLASTFDRPYRPFPVPLAAVRVGAALGMGGLGPERVRELTSPGFVCRVDRAEERLRFRAAIGLAEGFRMTADWYRRYGWL